MDRFFGIIDSLLRNIMCGHCHFNRLIWCQNCGFGAIMPGKYKHLSGNLKNSKRRGFFAEEFKKIVRFVIFAQ